MLKPSFENEFTTMELTKEFKNYLMELGYSKSSQSMLPKLTEDFLGYHNTVHPETITSSHIHEFYNYLQSRPHKRKTGALSEQYINHHVYALRVFFNWLETTGQLRTNPMSVLRFKRPKSNHREPFTQAEITQLFNVVQTAQENVILHLFYSCGLRRSEAETLQIRDVHFKQQLLYVREGKGAKRRVVPMPESVAKALEKYYLSERINQKNTIDTQAFVLNRIGSKMRGDGYNRVLKNLMARTELLKEASLHHLRHSIATHLLERGLSIEKVRDFLGHRHLETTQLYAKVAPIQVQNL